MGMGPMVVVEGGICLRLHRRSLGLGTLRPAVAQVSPLPRARVGVEVERRCDVIEGTGAWWDGRDWRPYPPSQL